MNEHIQLAMTALEAFRGDDLARAKAAFRGMSAEQLQQHYGESGQTCQEIIDGYQKHWDKCQAAIRYLLML